MIVEVGAPVATLKITIYLPVFANHEFRTVVSKFFSGRKSMVQDVPSDSSNVGSIH